MAIDDLPDTLLGQLAQGEQLLWAGKPNPDAYKIARREKAVRFSLVVNLFFGSLGLTYWALDGLGSSSVTCFVLGCVFSLIGFVSSSERFAPKWWHAVTDQRILTDYPTDGPERFTEVPLIHIENMRIKKYTQSSGTIQFNYSPIRQNCISFECIDDVEAVYQLIEDGRANLLFSPVRHVIDNGDLSAT